VLATLFAGALRGGRSAEEARQVRLEPQEEVA
jgi:hypothetical protein